MRETSFFSAFLKYLFAQQDPELLATVPRDEQVKGHYDLQLLYCAHRDPHQVMIYNYCTVPIVTHTNR